MRSADLWCHGYLWAQVVAAMPSHMWLKIDRPVVQTFFSLSTFPVPLKQHSNSIESYLIIIQIMFQIIIQTAKLHPFHHFFIEKILSEITFASPWAPHNCNRTGGAAPGPRAGSAGSGFRPGFSSWQLFLNVPKCSLSDLISLWSSNICLIYSDLFWSKSIQIWSNLIYGSMNWTWMSWDVKKLSWNDRNQTSAWFS